jgi:hypothetical protein
MRLFRPVGLTELGLMFDRDMLEFPPRLPEQPIFYPVLNEDYAVQIARDWNAIDAGSGFAGYVSEFAVATDYATQFPRRVVGTQTHEELWVPAADLADFNHHITDTIQVTHAYFGIQFSGSVPVQFGLRGKTAREQFVCLAGMFNYSGMDFMCEVSANRKSIFLNFPFWYQADFSKEGIPTGTKSTVIEAIETVWRDRFPRIHLCQPSVDSNDTHPRSD